MTADQFKALAELLRLRSGSPRECARLVLVDGQPIKDAAEAAGLSYRQGAAAVQRAREGLALAERAARHSWLFVGIPVGTTRKKAPQAA